MSLKQKKKIVVGNWKMNPENEKMAKKLAQEVRKVAGRMENVETVICPPHVFIPVVMSRSKVKVGAQNVFYEDRGSYTGEISPLALKALGVSHVIIGHSERRKMGESDNVVAKKVLKAVATGIIPIICIGEDVHDPDGHYLEIVKGQLLEALSLLKKTEIWKVIIAYEPVWAVGAEAAMTPYDLHQMSLYIRKVLVDEYGKVAIGVQVLYGGSVDQSNAAEIVSKGEVDGLLVGRESLNSGNFGALIRAVNNL